MSEIQPDPILTMFIFIRFPPEMNSHGQKTASLPAIRSNSIQHSTGGTDILSSSEWTSFNITTLVRAWKYGIYDESLGILMMLPYQASQSVKKAPYSSEYSTVDYRPYLHILYTETTYTHTIKAEVFYDNTYLTRYANATTRINQKMAVLQSYMLENLGVRLIYTAPEKTTSLADYCSQGIDSVCTHGTCEDATENLTSESHHSSLLSNLYYNKSAMSTPDVKTTVRILFIGRSACQAGYSGCGNIKGITIASHGITLIADSESSDSETATLVHEFLHFYGVSDHYNQEATYLNEQGEFSYNDQCLFGFNSIAWPPVNKIDYNKVNSELPLCQECHEKIYRGVLNRSIIYS